MPNLFNIAVVDSGVSNISAVINMFRKAGAEAEVVATPQGLKNQQAIVLPGVGSFDAGISAIENLGFKDAILEAASEGRFIFGICLGMQLLFDGSVEGQKPGLGLLPGMCAKFNFSDSRLKTPHMGWNEVHARQPHELLSGYSETPRFYFAHSYFAQPSNTECVLATTRYGHDIPCVIGQKNIFGVQFHPEKSHKFGIQLFKNFLGLVDGTT